MPEDALTSFTVSHIASLRVGHSYHHQIMSGQKVGHA